VAGDVNPEEVRRLAQESYGKVQANPAIVPRKRVVDPEQRAARRVELKDLRAGKPSLQRYYVAPSYVSAAPGEAEALDLLMKIAASGSTSRLYQRLVVDEKIASSAGGWYSGSGLDSGKIALYAVAADGVGLERVETGMDAVLAEIRDSGVTDAELERAKTAYLADHVYESDNQSTLARRYGWGLVIGRTVAEIDAWPERIAKVTLADIKKVAGTYLDLRRSVTGTLLPVAPEGGAAPLGVNGMPSRS
jgi:zinc protease